MKPAKKQCQKKAIVSKYLNVLLIVVLSLNLNIECKIGNEIPKKFPKVKSCFNFRVSFKGFKFWL